MKSKPFSWATFSGLNNRQRPEELDSDELSIARNIDIDDSGKLTRREGYTSIATLTGSYHSLWASNDETICLVVKGGDLYQINQDWTESLLRPSVGNAKMSYTEANGYVYYTNGLVIGYITEGVSHEFTNPVLQFKTATPAGQCIAYYNGRLYVAKGDVLWITDALALGRVDMRTGFKAFSSYIHMVRPVDGGIYVSDSSDTYFLSGPSPEKMSLKHVTSAAILGTDISVSSLRFSKEPIGSVALFSTADGTCLGLSDGSVISLTEKKYKFPSTINRGSALIRDDSGQISLITRLYN